MKRLGVLAEPEIVFRRVIEQRGKLLQLEENSIGNRIGASRGVDAGLQEIAKRPEELSLDVSSVLEETANEKAGVSDGFGVGEFVLRIIGLSWRVRRRFGSVRVQLGSSVG